MTRQRVLVVPDNVPPTYVELGDATAQQVVGVLARKPFLPPWRSARCIRSGAALMDLDALTSIDQPLPVVLDEVAAVLGDARTGWIAEREWGTRSGAFSSSTRIAGVVASAVQLLDRYGVTTVLFAATPHLPPEWVLGRTAELTGRRVLNVGKAAHPEYSGCFVGIDAQAQVHLQDPLTTRQEVDRDVAALVQRYQADYSTAVPANDAKAQTRPGGFMTTTLRQVRRQARLNGVPAAVRAGPGQALRTGQRLHLRTAYERLTTPTPRDGKIAALYLHYQPERTSVPEGGLFGNQLVLAQALASSLPPTWQLVVREHPATFHGPGTFIRAFRDEHTYRLLAALPRTTLSSLRDDAYALLDQAEMVVTLTGTVGLQAACRGATVVAAKGANFRTLPRVHSVDADAGSSEFQRVIRAAADAPRCTPAEVVGPVTRGLTAVALSSVRDATAEADPSRQRVAGRGRVMGLVLQHLAEGRLD